ncbi:hypothetical protein PZ895_17030 [Mesorhizobium sp. YIM 152430]|uniref:hypothetical protein n=1 Tax=Mesorhizobium sp. YIM 152430 TaxID=3031761 RepID=UPI0023DA01E7|nr:hypothetical protein [Mesorhizobium sp. YIM 152430]MDF1601464.1 hypothetical protein [Mesorhizobium sp. YIM 152430]
MSDFVSLVDRAKRAHSSVAKLEDALQQNPLDPVALLNLRSMRRVAERAREEMERAALGRHVDVCQYRLVPLPQMSFGLSNVARSLLGYQNLFSQLFDAFANGKKSRAVFGVEAQRASTLDMAYTFAGSLGVTLLAHSERDFFDGALDKPIDALYQVMEINNLDDVKDIAQSLGRAVVKRIHDWTTANVEGGFAADIRWSRSDGRQLGQVIDQGQMQLIAGYIGASSDTTTYTEEVRGMLVGANMLSRTFHLSVPEGDTYTGHISPDATLPPAMTLGRMYSAVIDVGETYYFATDKTVKSNALTGLFGPHEDLTAIIT